jgi:hypothetical protein
VTFQRRVEVEREEIRNGSSKNGLGGIAGYGQNMTIYKEKKETPYWVAAQASLRANQPGIFLIVASVVIIPQSCWARKILVSLLSVPKMRNGLCGILQELLERKGLSPTGSPFVLGAWRLIDMRLIDNEGCKKGAACRGRAG